MAVLAEPAGDGASPFHEGEREVQARAGALERMRTVGARGIRPAMPEQHRTFFQQLPFVAIGAVDGEGQPWASMLTGPPGFVGSPDDRHLDVRAGHLLGDPLAGRLVPGAAVGLLGIELHTRRRNRANGVVERADADGFSLAVRQSFGNCPQYIQLRGLRMADGPSEPTVCRDGTELDGDSARLVGEADTFFIATASTDGSGGWTDGADVSHRGGNHGFVRVEDGRTLLVPDFVGNFFFNTLGNIVRQPRVGLLFPDFATGDLLYVAASGEVVWDGPELRAFAGAERLLRLRVSRTRHVASSLPMRFSPPEFSPVLARTGSWTDALLAIEANRLRDAYRPFRIAGASMESETVRSLLLVPEDGGISPHEPGQFLPMRLPGRGRPMMRVYSLSDAANGRSYRISVRRQGNGSAWLHEAPVGSRVEALGPRGGFTYSPGAARPLVLVSAGIGVTPMIAILNSLLVNEGRSRHLAPIHFIHGARNGREHAFGAHLRQLQARHPNLCVHIRYSRPDPQDTIGVTHEDTGRVDAALVLAIAASPDCDYLLCGPTAFMQSLYDGLRLGGVADADIRTEGFGPASVVRTGREPVRKLVTAPATGEVPVTFARSGRTATWRSGSLLELAEAEGLSPEYSCRSGLCGTCSVRLDSGLVHYDPEPRAEMVEGECLICCAMPDHHAELSGGLTLNL